VYPEELVAPMRKELVNAGFTELKTADETEKALNEKSGSTLVVVNSVCGCAAGTARPGVVMSIKNSDTKPTNLYTVFAGMETDAVKKAREFMLPYPPSSPAVALFKNGNLVAMIERHQIEGRPAEVIATHLQELYKQFCS